MTISFFDDYDPHNTLSKNITDQLMAAVKTGDAVQLRALTVKCKILNTTLGSELLRDAAEAGHAECLKYLITLNVSGVAYTNALWYAAMQGHTECVRMLIPVSDPRRGQSEALTVAAKKGHTECVKLLIPVSDPKDNEQAALRCAVHNGHIACVQLLIPVSNPKFNHSQALQIASDWGNHALMDVLWDVSDPKAALADMQQRDGDAGGWEPLAQRIAAEEQRKDMHNVLHDCGTSGSTARTKKPKM